MSEHGAELIIRFQTLRPMSWRNGGGTTREIMACGTEGGEGFDWRLSLAAIEGSGRFSEFPGMKRIFTVVEGDLVVLAVDGYTRQVHHGVPFPFSGDSSVQASLPGGSVQALNVITRPAAVSASVVVDRLVPDRPHLVRPDQCVVVLSGRATLTAHGAEHGMGVYDTARFGGPGDAAITGEGLVAVVSLRPGSVA